MFLNIGVYRSLGRKSIRPPGGLFNGNVSFFSSYEDIIDAFLLFELSAAVKSKLFPSIFPPSSKGDVLQNTVLVRLILFIIPSAFSPERFTASVL